MNLPDRSCLPREGDCDGDLMEPSLHCKGNTGSLVEYVKGADALVIEATYLDEEVDMAKQFAHLTARQAAELARSAGVKQLFLTHISRRYREKDVFTEAEAVFPNVRVARDFDHFMITRSETEEN